MKITITQCDLCKKPDAKTYYFIVGRGLDPAGSTEDKTENVDLCDEHAAKMLSVYSNSIHYDLNLEVFKKLQTRIHNQKT